MSEEEGAKKPQVSEEDRLALCQKLDKELDEFIDGLEKKQYTDGWSEDTWEEEMEKHPFFMRSTPGAGMSPLAEGLAQLKYDPDENTPVELANNYKEDGNFNFKHKNYRLAIMGYTEGIKVKCDDPEVNASLYNNRATAHFHLKNYRSALLDSEKALSFNPKHAKARIRAARSAFEAAKYDVCVTHCEKHLENQADDDIARLLHTAKKKKLVQDRDQRKKEKKEEKDTEKQNEVVEAVKDRKIRVWRCKTLNDIDITKLDPKIQGATVPMVYLENGVLHWPLLSLIPEYQLTEFCTDCSENEPLRVLLDKAFPAPWDVASRYTWETINIFYEGYDLKPRLVDPSKKLRDIMTEKYYLVKAGTPAFVIVPKGSQAEKVFLQSYFK